jgi:hypothetical protein
VKLTKKQRELLECAAQNGGTIYKHETSLNEKQHINATRERVLLRMSELGLLTPLKSWYVITELGQKEHGDIIRAHEAARAKVAR